MIVGVDPGLDGCITYMIDGEPNFCKFIPTIGKEYDVKGMTDIFKQIKVLTEISGCHVFIEKVHAIYGASAGSTFKFGYGCGLLEGIVATLGLPYTMVQPKEWQKEMFRGLNEIRKPSKRNVKGVLVKGQLETKKMTELACKRLFPEVDIYITSKGNKSKKAHDGLCDSLLIAEYGRRLLSR